MGAGLHLNGKISSSRFPVSAFVAIAAVHAHTNGTFSAYPSLHNLTELMTRLDESSHDADEHSQLLRSYPHAGDIDRLYRVPSHRSTPAFLPKVIEAATTLLPLPCLPSGSRALPPLGEDVVAARRVRPSRPASACSFSTLRLNLMLSGAASIYSYRHMPSGQSRVYRITQLRTDGVHCRESTGTGSVVLKVVPVMGATN